MVGSHVDCQCCFRIQEVKTRNVSFRYAKVFFFISARVRNVIVHACSVDATRIWPEL